MARRLKTLAKLINETMPEYRAEVTVCRLNTDGSCHGGRIRIPRKGIMGNRISICKRGTFQRVFTHHTGEWPTTNEYVERWISEHFLTKKA